MRYLHSGGANAPAGLYLIDVDGAYLANGTREDDTTELAEVEVNVTEHAAGRPVYLFANKLVTGSWANLFVDNIRFVDSGGNELQCPGPPSLPPYPPRDPPSSPASAAGIAGDPKLRGGHGDEADFRGENHAVYNALSARNLSVALLIEHGSFRTSHSKLNVHGSWVRGAFHTVRTRRTARVLQIFFHAIDPHRAVITEGCTAPYCKDRVAASRRHVLREGALPFVAENVLVTLHRKTLNVANGQWRTSCTSTVGAPHPGRLRVNLEIRPTYPVDRDPVAPHGLIGQTYDRDRFEVNGRQDNYSLLDDGRPTASRHGPGGHVTTRAKAEGAIEGKLEDYRLASDFATAFRSRALTGLPQLRGT